jgi:hypothetical protein
MTYKVFNVKITKQNTIAMGRFIKIVYGPAIDRLLERQYGRSGLCFKVLRQKVAEDKVWEVTSFEDVAKLQNLGAIHGIAPRIYDIVNVNGRLAQVTDYLQSSEEPSLDAIGRLIGFLKGLDVGTKKLTGPGGKPKYDLAAAKNWIGNKFVDWGGYYLRYPQQYTKQLMERATLEITKAGRGQPANKTYQTLSDFGLLGSRDMQHRLEMLQLDKLDFTGKTVLDLGCNLGFFCHYAHQRGAKIITGVDVPELIRPTEEIANWLGHWNIDFIGAELPKEVDGVGGPYDIVFAFSICNHVGGYRQWISDLCSDIMILEGHGGDKPERYEEQLKRDFKSVELINYSTDCMTRPIFRCQK